MIVASNIDSPKNNISAWSIKQEMKRAGYTDIACALALKKLSNISFLVSEKIADDYHYGEYTAYTIIDSGMQWLEDNKARLKLQVYGTSGQDSDFAEDIPF